MATKIKTVNTTQAAEMCGVQTRTFRRMCERENITPVGYRANEILYRRTDVTKLIRKSNQSNTRSSNNKSASTKPSATSSSTSSSTFTASPGFPSV